MRICVPIPADSTAAAIDRIREINPLADVIELRIDSIKDPDIAALLAAALKPVIVTNRRAAEGGGFRGTEEQRVEILRQAVALGAAYVDIEVRTAAVLKKALISEAAARGGATRLIVSYHDFAGTPSESELERILAECRGDGAIVKIATMANDIEDNIRVLKLVSAARGQGIDIIAFCMGRMGKLSRIAAPLCGSYLGYASLERGLESAPGQLTVAEMRDIFRMLGNGR